MKTRTYGKITYGTIVLGILLWASGVLMQEARSESGWVFDEATSRYVRYVTYEIGAIYLSDIGLLVTLFGILALFGVITFASWSDDE
jgi:hypothetical protein